MKKTKVILTLGVLFSALVFTSCQKNELEPIQKEKNIMPERFKVDIPNSISSSYLYKDSDLDTLQGADIYQHMRTFIHVGEHAADIVGDIILVISWHNLSQPMSFTFTSEDDGRLKHVDIIENATFEGYTWAYKMTITDEGPGDSGNENTALQIFWDKNPIKGIALLNPYNIDRNTNPKFLETMYRIDYSEEGDLGYEHHMIVTIDGLPMEDPLTEPYGMSTMKMFVGKNGDAVSVFGNSEHPNATFFSGETGFDWAFTAAGKNSEDIGVAEVGLPSNTLNSSDRYALLIENSIKNVFETQIYTVWPWIDPETVEAYLYNTEAPGFFDHYGFVQGGTAPSQNYNELLNIIAGLSPYNPLDIHNLQIVFD
ncbi:MAG: hypothetical protein K9G76_05920 [Bacteroidales bacterium]|nr:hypothetical protein [Bacteroidales bacterium]MCF8402435.1 hypothetical protein [Bacteroidales bacterium]